MDIASMNTEARATQAEFGACDVLAHTDEWVQGEKRATAWCCCSTDDDEEAIAVSVDVVAEACAGSGSCSVAVADTEGAIARHPVSTPTTLSPASRATLTKPKV